MINIYVYDYDASNFDYIYDIETDAKTICGYHGTNPNIVIPE